MVPPTTVSTLVMAARRSAGTVKTSSDRMVRSASVPGPSQPLSRSVFSA